MAPPPLPVGASAAQKHGCTEEHPDIGVRRINSAMNLVHGVAVVIAAYAIVPVPARLIVRRVRDRNHPDELFPVWRYHPFFTNSTASVTAADIAHRQHAIIESVFADVIDGPLAHLPSGSFSANSAWTVLAAITHNLLRAAGTLASKSHARARGATLRRHLVNVPARIARPQGKRTLHLPAHWPQATPWKALWNNTFTNETRQVAA